MSLLSHTGDAVAELVLSMTRCRWQVMLTTVLPSHTGDGDAEATWPWSNVDVASC
jgi:hypothetical protein